MRPLPPTRPPPCGTATPVPLAASYRTSPHFENHFHGIAVSNSGSSRAGVCATDRAKQRDPGGGGCLRCSVRTAPCGGRGGKRRRRGAPLAGVLGLQAPDRRPARACFPARTPDAERRSAALGVALLHWADLPGRGKGRGPVTRRWTLAGAGRRPWSSGAGSGSFRPLLPPSVKWSCRFFPNIPSRAPLTASQDSPFPLWTAAPGIEQFTVFG